MAESRAEAAAMAHTLLLEGVACTFSVPEKGFEPFPYDTSVIRVVGKPASFIRLINACTWA